MYIHLFTMKTIRRTFLFRLYETDKWLFVLLVAFILMQMLFTFKGVETLPFFNYGMYSAKQFPQEEYHAIAIDWNDSTGEVSKVRTLPVDYLSSVVSYYAMLKEEKFHDPNDETVQRRFKGLPGTIRNQIIFQRLENTHGDEALFFSWLCRYLHSFYKDPVKNIKITDRSYEWLHGKFTMKNETIIYSYSCIP